MSTTALLPEPVLPPANIDFVPTVVEASLSRPSDRVTAFGTFTTSPADTEPPIMAIKTKETILFIILFLSEYGVLVQRRIALGLSSGFRLNARQLPFEVLAN